MKAYGHRAGENLLTLPPPINGEFGRAEWRRGPLSDWQHLEAKKP